jgi:hypothetical protein
MIHEATVIKKEIKKENKCIGSARNRALHMTWQWANYWELQWLP